MCSQQLTVVCCLPQPTRVSIPRTPAMGCAVACTHSGTQPSASSPQLCAPRHELHFDDNGWRGLQVLRLGNVVPDFSAQTTQGDMPSFHEWIDGSWAILFSHPADFTVRPVLQKVFVTTCPQHCFARRSRRCSTDSIGIGRTVAKLCSKPRGRDAS